MRKSQRGISLVELVAVLAIGMLVVGLGAAAWNHAVQGARAAACLHNLRTIGAAAAAFSADNDGDLPATAHQRRSWVASLQPYLGSKRPYCCPSDPDRRRGQSYAINDFLTPTRSGPGYSRRQNLPRPAATLFMTETSDTFSGGDHFHFADEETGAPSPAAVRAETALDRHGQGLHVLFVDGHVRAVPADELSRLLEDPDSAFLHPNP